MQQQEREYFGADHCEAGAWLVEKWRLPRLFVEVARHHHTPTAESDQLVILVNASCLIANQLGFSVTVSEPEEGSGGNDKLASSITETIGVLEREYGIAR